MNFVLLASALRKFPSDWSKDGRYLVYSASGKDTGWDHRALPHDAGPRRDSAGHGGADWTSALQ